MILGSAGAGKSTLAAALGERTGLPVVHLDVLFWRPGWVAAPEHQARRELSLAVDRPGWIIEGNFLPPRSGELDPRFGRADTVVFLDVPRLRCAQRVLVRLVRDHGRRRADLPEGCWEGIDIPLLRWIWGYQKTDRPSVLGILRRLPGRVAVHRLRSDTDARKFLASLQVTAGHDDG